MKEKDAPFFYVIYPQDKTVQLILNSIKILADETQSTNAHITVRGPYFKSKIKNNLIQGYSKKIKNEIIEIDSIGNFFEFSQNTIFLNCKSNKKLQSIWYKSTYKDFKPHITIYNGDNSLFAKKLFSKLKEDFQPFNIKIDELQYLEPKIQRALPFYNLINDDNFKILSLLTNNTINNKNLSNFNDEKRINFINDLFKKINDPKTKKTITNNLLAQSRNT